ncbi:phage minor head protein [Arsenophonus sp. PmNCSU2021_1]|uniref:phage minor head protein n=1 Tax=Arsenophonus sp. PmNCSU2021_1 TaxID=3118989 RepID=UPI002FF2B0D1
MRTVNERLMDELLAHSLFTGRYGSGVAKKMVNTLNAYDAQLSASLIVALDDANIDAESFTVRRLESLLASVKAINKNAVASAFSLLSDEMKAHTEYEVKYYPALIDFLMPEGVLRRYPLMSLTADMLYSAVIARPFQGKRLSEWADGLEKDRMIRISNTVRNGYLNGDSAVEMGRKIRGHVKQGYKDGVLQISRANATSIAKTAINHLQATARNQFAEANKKLLEGKQWLSTLDNKTSHTCIVRDRLKYTIEGKPIGHKVPYLQGPGKIHWNCRSTETLITKSWRQLGIDVDEMNEGTRASMDGEIPEGTTFLEWIQRQPVWRQKQVFGEVRYRLMKEGDMHPSEFYTDKGEFISLAQLREIDEQAFKEAGMGI